jgi:DNA repair protein RAD16
MARPTRNRQSRAAEQVPDATDSESEFSVPTSSESDLSSVDSSDEFQDTSSFHQPKKLKQVPAAPQIQPLDQPQEQVAEPSQPPENNENQGNNETGSQQSAGNSKNKKGRKPVKKPGLEVLHPELKGVWERLEEQEVIAPDPVSQPAGITVTLLKFQLEGLNWLQKQEDSECALLN